MAGAIDYAMGHQQLMRSAATLPSLEVRVELKVPTSSAQCRTLLGSLCSRTLVGLVETFSGLYSV